MIRRRPDHGGHTVTAGTRFDAAAPKRTTQAFARPAYQSSPGAVKAIPYRPVFHSSWW